VVAHLALPVRRARGADLNPGGCLSSAIFVPRFWTVPNFFVVPVLLLSFLPSTRATLTDAFHQASNRRRSDLLIEVEAKAVEEHRKYVT
jgi:hypothetical protein